MAKAWEVLEMLIPQGGWVLQGEDYEGIEFTQCDPITKEQFLAGFAQYDAFKAQKDAEKVAEKAALLAKLGISEHEAKLLLG
jgi:hypothetical protein